MKRTCDLEKCTPANSRSCFENDARERLHGWRRITFKITIPTIRSATNGTLPTPGTATVSVGGDSQLRGDRPGFSECAVSADDQPYRSGGSAVSASGACIQHLHARHCGFRRRSEFRGVPAGRRGPTTETNFTIGSVGVGCFHKVQRLVGVTASYGASVGAGTSTSESGTVVFTGQTLRTRWISIDDQPPHAACTARSAIHRWHHHDRILCDRCR